MKEWNLVIYAPAYNSELTIRSLLERMEAMSVELGRLGIYLKLFLVVDDGSTDRTLEIMEDVSKKYPFLKIVAQESNMGPAKAILRGMEEVSNALEESSLNPSETIVVRMDSDLEHIPEDLPKLLTPIIKGNTDVSVGFIPFDERSGKEMQEFNLTAGREESKDFLGMEIPQFCPGYNAIRASVFLEILPVLRGFSLDFQRETGIEMLSIDFIILVISKMLGKKIIQSRLSPIQDEYIKTPSPEKIKTYKKYHQETMSFLKKKLP